VINDAVECNANCSGTQTELVEKVKSNARSDFLMKTCFGPISAFVNLAAGKCGLGKRVIREILAAHVVAKSSKQQLQYTVTMVKPCKRGSRRTLEHVLTVLQFQSRNGRRFALDIK
jgi:hypothetical protein